MKKTLSIVLCVLLVLLAVACSPETKTHEHNYVLNEEKSVAPSCTYPGYEYWECECGERVTMVAAPVPENHKWNDGVEETKATCVAEGKKVYTCEDCGKTYDETIAIDSYNHVEGYTSNAKVVLYPTCATEGYGTLDCAACKKTGVRYTIEKTSKHYKLEENAQVEITKEDVKENDWVYKKKSTAFVKGTRYGICPICGKADAVEDEVDYDDTTVLGEYTFKDGEDSSYTQYTFTISVSKAGVYSVEIYKMDATGTTPKTTKINVTSAGFGVMPEDDALTEKGSGSRVFDINTNGVEHIYLFENIAAQEKTGSSKEERAIYAAYTEDESAYKNEGKVTCIEREHDWTYTEETRVSDTYHTVSCTSCGLKNYLQEHTLGTCKICNYSSTTWYSVVVSYCSTWTGGAYNSGATETETYYLKNGVSFSCDLSNNNNVTWSKVDGSTQNFKGYALTGLSYTNGKLSKNVAATTCTLVLGNLT